MTYATITPTHEDPATCQHRRRAKFDSHRCFDCGTLVPPTGELDVDLLFPPTPAPTIQAAIDHLEDGPVTVLVRLSAALYRDGWPNLSDRVLDVMAAYRDAQDWHALRGEAWYSRERVAFVRDRLTGLMEGF